MLTREELLVLLIEECGEVIQAATKCLRFGVDRYDPRDPGKGSNYTVLSEEIGDLYGVVSGLPTLDWAAIKRKTMSKIDRAEKAKSDCEET